MNYKAVRFSLTASDEESRELVSMGYELLSSIAGEAGFESFEESENGLTGYIPESLFDEETLGEVCNSLPLEGIEVHYTVSEVKEKDWNAEWERTGYEPIVIDDLLCIHDCLHALPEGTEVAHEIIIDAQQAFGTGTHETTRMITRRLFSLPLSGKRVLDCGCGTGILSIAAKKAGADSIVAYDIDDWSVRNTLHNIDLNGVSDIEVLSGDRSILSHVSGMFDLVLANINRNVLLDDMETFNDVIRDDGTVILSGFYEHDAPLLIEKGDELGWRLEDQEIEADWCMIVLKVER
ncbi:MAG: 50S ribosomal protein L11 methyltransferase [Prevotella sp.]|nr:50S ribosomal protein L11 methyltransferase [Prevotella sp.]